MGENAATRGSGAGGTYAAGFAAAFFTSAMVITPSALLARTWLKSTFNFFANARTAGMAFTPPMAIACSLRTAFELSIAPTTVPASSLSSSSGACSAGAMELGSGAGGVGDSTCGAP